MSDKSVSRIFRRSYWQRKINKFLFLESSKLHQQTLRVWYYRCVLSENKRLNVAQDAIFRIPHLFLGKGSIEIKKNYSSGGKTGPHYHNGYNHLDARNENSKITIGSDTFIHNGATLISEGEGIEIGNNVLIATNFLCADSDFHNIHPSKRHCPRSVATAKVTICDNVWIGFNVTVLKGVRIGTNSVIGAGSTVTKSIPDNVVAAGNPARIIKSLLK